MMTPHLLAFAGAVAQNAVLANIPTISDNFFTQTLSGMFSTKSFSVLQAYVRLDSGSQALINAPSLRAFGPPQLWPWDGAAAPPNDPPLIRYCGCGPFVPLEDPINIQVSRAGAGAADAQALLLVGDAMPTPYVGPCRSVRATATITAVVNQWTAGTLNLDQTLPAGDYMVIGMAAFGTGLLAARLIFPERTERPGILAQQAAIEYDESTFRYGQFGVWGKFKNVSLPQLEVLAYAANATQTVILDLVRVGGGL